MKFNIRVLHLEFLVPKVVGKVGSTSPPFWLLSSYGNSSHSHGDFPVVLFPGGNEMNHDWPTGSPFLPLYSCLSWSRGCADEGRVHAGMVLEPLPLWAWRDLQILFQAKMWQFLGAEEAGSIDKQCSPVELWQLPEMDAPLLLTLTCALVWEKGSWQIN